MIVEPAKIELDSGRESGGEASLPKHLKNANDRQKAAQEREEELQKTPALKEVLEEEEHSLFEKDYQLARAIDFLRGIHIYTMRNIK